MAKKVKKAPAKKAAKAKKTKTAAGEPAKKKTKTAAPKVAKKKKLTKAAAAAAAEVSENERKWLELNQKHGKADAPTYEMSGVFEAKAPIKHKVLGWGFVLNNDNDRLEVLFEGGVKTLISNYKRSS